MLRVAMRGLLARKLRTVLTGFAVVLGVAFVAGTFVFTDTIDASFKDLFERAHKGEDVSIEASQAVKERGRRTLSRTQLSTTHPRLQSVSPAVGKLDGLESLEADDGS